MKFQSYKCVFIIKINEFHISINEKSNYPGIHPGPKSNRVPGNKTLVKARPHKLFASAYRRIRFNKHHISKFAVTDQVETEKVLV